ncbi:hypothetical protein [Prochlorococcus sp. MIT 1307]|uniref:hypothetical protein n=1 Tax=Prochlorococcus sp. MIT 1307 TaxID=3096219 RepID=UPI002A75C568|nr:hypothetical protein [Prochlorococcus sp. MIT 1307]
MYTTLLTQVCRYGRCSMRTPFFMPVLLALYLYRWIPCDNSGLNRSCHTCIRTLLGGDNKQEVLNEKWKRFVIPAMMQMLGINTLFMRRNERQAIRQRVFLVSN